MLSLAVAKLEEALEIIDNLGAHLPGIHVANALLAINDLALEDSTLNVVSDANASQGSN